jgi:hypothetical protein
MIENNTGCKSGTKEKYGIGFIMGIAIGVAVTALILWFLEIIEPPIGILAGATAVGVILAVGRYKKRIK